MKRHATGLRLLPECAKGMRDKQEEMHRDGTECAALRWDYSRQTVQRALLCAFDLHVPNPLAKRMHLYVHIDEIGTANNDESLQCFLGEGYGVDVTLLYPCRPKERCAKLGEGLRPRNHDDVALFLNSQKTVTDAKAALATARENIPKPLPTVAGINPIRGLVVVDVPVLQSTDELAVAETIRFNEDRTEIRKMEFWCMFNLRELPPHMPNLGKIGEFAFMNCTGLTVLGQMNKLKTIEKGAFKTCVELTALGQMDALKTIGDNAFRGCTGLTELGDMNALQTIGRGAFARCTKLQQLGQMNALKTIGDNAFRGCTGLIQVGQMNALASILPSAFGGCTSLKELPELPSLERILSCAFWGCTNLESMHLGAKLQFIESGAFELCSRLKNIHADYNARRNVLICVDKTVSRLIHSASPNHKSIIHVEDIPSPHMNGWSRAYAKCALNSRWGITPFIAEKYANVKVTDALDTLNIPDGETVTTWLHRSTRNRVFLRENGKFIEAIAHFVSDSPGDGGILDAHIEKSCLHVQCGRAYGDDDYPGVVKHGDVNMSRWFWMIASASLGTIFVPVAGVLSPPSPLLKLGNVAENQSVALLATVPVIHGYNIFNEFIDVDKNGEENNVRLCKSRDYLSLELIPVSLMSATQDHFNISRRKPDPIIIT